MVPPRNTAKQSTVLALPGPVYTYDYGGQGFPVGDARIVIHQEGGQGRGTAWAVWDGAVALAKYLEEVALNSAVHVPSPTTLVMDPVQSIRIKPSRILELGSGTGLAGLAAAALFRVAVILTDLPEVLPALHHNVQANPDLASLVTVTACDWTRPQDWENGLLNLNKPFDLILVADCVWLDTLVEPLVNTLRLLATPKQTTILLSHQPRSARVDEKFFSLLETWFSIVEADNLSKEPRRSNSPIKLFWLTVRQENM